jgi:hypothetical protein
MAITNDFLLSGFQSLLADWVPKERRGRVTSTVGTGAFYLDIRGTTSGGGMLLFIPMALGQTIGGTAYMFDPSLPLLDNLSRANTCVNLGIPQGEGSKRNRKMITA